MYIDSLKNDKITEISNILDTHENILIFLSEKNEDYFKIEKELKIKFWKKIGNNKLLIMIVPEINLFYIFKDQKIEYI